MNTVDALPTSAAAGDEVSFQGAVHRFDGASWRPIYRDKVDSQPFIYIRRGQGGYQNFVSLSLKDYGFEPTIMFFPDDAEEIARLLIETAQDIRTNPK